jgi:hypothetical protein
MAWPVRDAWQEIPYPRLLADVPVSVGGTDAAPITIMPAKPEPFEAVAGSKLTIPLVHVRHSEFSGATMTMNVFGAGFEQVPAVNIPLTTDASELTLDLAALKTPPGDYTIALYGPAVAKYRHHPEDVPLAEAALRKAEEEVKALADEAKKLAGELQAATVEQKPEIEQAIKDADAKQKAAALAVTAAAEQLKKATALASPKDIVDIVVSKPIAIRVKPAETK